MCTVRRLTIVTIVTAWRRPKQARVSIIKRYRKVSWHLETVRYLYIHIYIYITVSRCRETYICIYMDLKLPYYLADVSVAYVALRWRHNGRDWHLKSPASRLFTQPFIQTQIKENIKALCHWLCAGNSSGTGEFPARMASNAENVSIWWRHHGISQQHDHCDTQSRGLETLPHSNHQHLMSSNLLKGVNFVLEVLSEAGPWSKHATLLIV